MPAQRLTSLDSSFLHLETPNTHMHIGGVAVFEAADGRSDEQRFELLLKHVGPRLDLIPRYRQRVAFLPLNVDIPVWVDDDRFDIHFHVRRAALPSPGADRELAQFCERVFSRQLDRRRPLWELYYVEGLEGGRWALLSKVHHALVDGISAVELATILLDSDADYRTPQGGSAWRPAPAPGTFDLLLRSLQERARSPIGLVRNARKVSNDPQKLADALRDTAGGLAATVQHIRAPDSPLNGSTGPTRTVWWSRFPLQEFKEVKEAFGATINDVVLAVVAGGLREYLALHDDDADSMRLKALCPVSIRDASERTALGNRLSMMLVQLPVDEPNPVIRMGRVKNTVERLKRSKQPVGAGFLLRLAGWSPATLHAMVSRVSLKQIGYNLIVTNVPGPQRPLYCLGNRMVESMPIAFLYDGQRIAIAIFSYAGRLDFGYIADRDHFDDLPSFGACMERSFRDLLAVARVPLAVAADRLAGTPGSGRIRRPAPRRRPAPSRRPAAPSKS